MDLNTVSENKNLSSFQTLNWAFFHTNKHFINLSLDISFTLLLFICLFVPMWVYYINTFGAEHFIVSVMFTSVMHLSFVVVILFMVGLCLFNRICSSSQVLTFWGFTKEVSWPWLVEGIKASIIIFAGLLCFVIPGIIKQIHYAFFSFVVFFNKNYKEDKIDALKHSKKLSKGVGWWIFGLFIVPPYFIGQIPGSVSQIVFAQTDSLWIIYPTLILSLYVTYLIFTYIYSILFFIYAIKDQSQMVGSVKVNIVSIESV
ncbi:MAG: hypothetical protein OXM55_02285 [Bdellovibrionales bacterium]|nr:hypothetical protein [Bdellovibrionales bacterium]